MISRNRVVQSNGKLKSSNKIKYNGYFETLNNKQLKNSKIKID